MISWQELQCMNVPIAGAVQHHLLSTSDSAAFESTNAYHNGHVPLFVNLVRKV